MHGDLSALVKSAKKILQNRLTHLCIAVVNCLGNSSSHQKSISRTNVHKIIFNNTFPTTDQLKERPAEFSIYFLYWCYLAMPQKAIYL